METAALVHSFDVSLKWDDETNIGIAHAGNRMPLAYGPPPEFGGTDTAWSPEHLLAASIASCYATTFSHFAKLLNVTYTDFRVTCKAEFEKGKTGFEATRYIVSPAVEVALNTSQELIDDLFTKAKKYCFIGNSVKGEIIVEPSISLR